MNKRILRPDDPRWPLLHRRARIFWSMGVPIRVGWSDRRSRKVLRRFIRKNPLYKPDAVR